MPSESRDLSTNSSDPQTKVCWPVNVAIRFAAIYFIAAGLWIVYSDKAIEWFTQDHAKLQMIQSFKGLFFVTITTLALYALIYGREKQRASADAALRYSENQFRSAFRLAAVGMTQADPVTGRYLAVNDKMCQITGYSETELLSKTIADLTHPDDRARDQAEIERVQRGEAASLSLRKRYIRKDGSIAYVHVDGTVMRDADGKTMRAVAVVQDVTEWEAARQKLLQSEMRFSELADAVPAMVFTADTSGLPDYFNKRWEEYVGMSVEEARRSDWKGIIHDDDLPGVMAGWRQSLVTGERFSIEYRIRGKGRTDFRWHLIVAIASRDNSGAIVKWFATITDIHDLKMATEQVRRLNATLEERVRERTIQMQAANEELRAYSYTVSHDLRSPLRGAQTLAMSLLAPEAEPLAEPAADKVRRIVASTARMQSLITDLLEYSQLAKTELKLMPTSTVTIVHELVGSLARDPATASAHVTFVEPLPWVMAHRLVLQQVFANLVGNAVKFVRPGEEAFVNIRAEQHGQMARIWFDDHGVGIAPEHLERIFEPFERSINGRSEIASAPRGMGVGLAMVKRAVERMGGTVGVESTLGEGSRFWIELAEVDVSMGT